MDVLLLRWRVKLCGISIQALIIVWCSHISDQLQLFPVILNFTNTKYNHDLTTARGTHIWNQTKVLHSPLYCPYLWHTSSFILFLFFPLYCTIVSINGFFFQMTSCMVTHNRDPWLHTTVVPFQHKKIDEKWSKCPYI